MNPYLEIHQTLDDFEQALFPMVAQQTLTH